MMKSSILATLVLVLGCSVSDKDRCSEGRVWSAEFSGCLPPDTSGTAGSTSTETTTPEGGTSQGGETAVAGGGSGGTTVAPLANLGTACTKNDDSPCTAGNASVCLYDGTSTDANPSGVCSIPNCQSTDCGEAFDCCNCSASPVQKVKASYPVPLCFPAANVTALTGYGCTCS